jgi:MFS transporter, DHA2 family, multidrug resistance protein
MATAPSITHTGPEPAKTHKWLVALAVMLGCSMEVLDVTIINVALPHMQGSLSASVDEIAWVVTSYLVANGVMIPMTGWISARFGRKRYFLTSVAMFIAASAMCGAARSLDQIVLFRLLQGAAGAAMIPSSQAIMMETFPPDEQQMAMALWGMGLMVAPIMGPTLGGWITDNWSWRWNFYINVPVGIVAFMMVSAFVHDPSFMRGHRAQSAPVDYLGIILLVVGLGTMQILLDRGQRADWFASIWVRYATVVTVGAIVGLVIHEFTFNDPILDLRIFKYPLFDAAVFLARPQLPALRHRPPCAHLPPGPDGLYGVGRGSRDDSARPRLDVLDVNRRPSRARRLQQPPPDRLRLHSDDHRLVADGALDARC